MASNPSVKASASRATAVGHGVVAGERLPDAVGAGVFEGVAAVEGIAVVEAVEGGAVTVTVTVSRSPALTPPHADRANASAVVAATYAVVARRPLKRCTLTPRSCVAERPLS